jgi:hypothetical protein
LGKRFGENHTGHDRIPGEMPGQHWIIRVEPGSGVDGLAGIATEHFAHENERRRVGQRG